MLSPAPSVSHPLSAWEALLLEGEGAFHPRMGTAQPHSTSPLSCLGQAPGKRGSRPELTELVYILGSSFLAVCFLTLHLPPFHLLPPSTLGWGHHGGSMKKKQAAAMLASPFQPRGSPQTRSGATAQETSPPSLRSGGGENALHTSREQGSSREGACRHPRAAHRCRPLLASPLFPQANGLCS